MIEELKKEGLSNKEIIFFLVNSIGIHESIAAMMVEIEINNYPGDSINTEDYPEYAIGNR
jgi:hypothetical protein